jgi:membrane carboxypeptidase/penicillin-binding protein
MPQLGGARRAARLRAGTPLSSVFTERRTVIPFDTIPSQTKLAFLAAEDARGAKK